MASPSFMDACANALVLAWIAAESSLFSASLRSAMAFSIARRSVSLIFEPCSERLLGRVDERLGVVLGLHRRLALLVLLGMSLGVLDHPLDVGFGETAGGLDADLLFLAGRLVLGRDVDDAVGVDVEGDLDLRHAARGRRNAD